MSVLVGANLGLRFALELAALATLAVWGFRTGDGPAAELALGAGLPLAVAAIWGAFIGPRAPSPAAVKAALQVLVFGAATLALAATHGGAAAAAFASVVAVNAALLAVLEGPAS